MGERGIGCDQAKKGRWELGARAEQERRGCSWREACGCRGGRKQEDEDMKGRVGGAGEMARGCRVQRGQKAGHRGPCQHGQILGLCFKNID